MGGRVIYAYPKILRQSAKPWLIVIVFQDE